MENTEIVWHPTSTKLCHYVLNLVQPKLCASFPVVYAKHKHNYNSWSATESLLDIPLTKTVMYEKTIKNHCIRDWNYLKKPIPDISYSDISFSKIKSCL